MSTTAASISSLKDEVEATIEERSGAFVRLAHDIHAHPEVAFAEGYAAARITDVLADEGFAMRRGVTGLPTAFIASVGSGSLHIAFCAEYDALDDGIGHGCGHNLIAGAAVAAAIGLHGVVDEAVESAAGLGMLARPAFLRWPSVRLHFEARRSHWSCAPSNGSRQWKCRLCWMGAPMGR